MRARLERKAKEEIRALEEGGEEDAGELEDRVDMVYLSEAHAKLLNIIRLVAVVGALWLIWSPGLPALNLLESISLWEVVDSSDPDGGMRTITLFDLTFGVIIIVITALVAKHLPAIVQLFLLEWVNISGGARYASSILMQYIVVAVGGSMFLSTVGWEWSNLQWLVAALGVGIGFGLQEIVANFICGIIILFEQPIRVGDIISAGGAEGTVKKISARATVIQTFDGKEHLVPNKELITGQVINWSLSENTVRVVIPVGIAYGSDVRRAMELLLEAAREVELVLPDPEPRATFEDFGDNALVLWLRCYVAEDRPGAWTELRTCINDKFAAAGIVIAFPQRDLHLDFAEALKVELG
jgi:potassium efflux system protein